jgi:hypothetical protein
MSSLRLINFWILSSMRDIILVVVLVVFYQCTFRIVFEAKDSPRVISFINMSSLPFTVIFIVKLFLVTIRPTLSFILFFVIFIISLQTIIMFESFLFINTNNNKYKEVSLGFMFLRGIVVVVLNI